MKVLQGVQGLIRTLSITLLGAAATLAAPTVHASEVVKLTRIVIIGKRVPATPVNNTTSSGTNATTPADRTRDLQGSSRPLPAPLRWFKTNPA